MAQLSMSILHKLSQDEALRRIKNLLTEVKTQFADKISDLHEQWDGNGGTFSFSAMGFSISGVLAVKSDKVELLGKLPFAASFFIGKIEAIIRDRAEKLLAP